MKKSNKYKGKRVRLPKVGDRLKDNYDAPPYDDEIGTVTLYNTQYKEYHVKWSRPDSSDRSATYSIENMTYLLGMQIFVYIVNPNKIWKDLNS